MRVLILSLITSIAMIGAPSQAKELLYFIVDAEMPIEQRRVVSDFADELVSKSRLGRDFDLFLHVEGINIFYPNMPALSASSSYDVRSFLGAVSQIAGANNFIEIMRSKNPNRVSPMEPQDSFGVASKNIIGMAKDRGEYENIYFIQLSNFDFLKPTDTTGQILGDGWITSTKSPLREFVNGSQSRAFSKAKVFVVVSETPGAPLTWFSGRATFWQKFYSSVGADIIAVKRIGNMPYGGGALLANSFINAITTDFQSYDRVMPRNTELIQLISSETGKATTLQ